MATLSQHSRPTIHDSSAPSNTPKDLKDIKNLRDSNTSTPRSSTSDRHPPDLPPPPLPPVAGPATTTTTAVGPAYSHRHTASVSASVSRLTLNQRSSSGFLAFAAAALDKTQSALANISEPSIRPRQSNGALARLSLLSSSNPNSEPTSPEKFHRLRSSSNQSLNSSYYLDGKLANQAALVNNPPSQPYSATDPTRPLPIRFPSSSENKMHQTSSRLLRMTDDDRPFTKVC